MFASFIRTPAVACTECFFISQNHTNFLIIVLDCANLYIIVLDCTKLYIIVLDSIYLYITVIYCTKLYNIVLNCTKLYMYIFVIKCIKLYVIVLDCTKLYIFAIDGTKYVYVFNAAATFPSKHIIIICNIRTVTIYFISCFISTCISNNKIILTISSTHICHHHNYIIQNDES